MSHSYGPQQLFSSPLVLDANDNRSEDTKRLKIPRSCMTLQCCFLNYRDYHASMSIRVQYIKYAARHMSQCTYSYVFVCAYVISMSMFHLNSSLMCCSYVSCLCKCYIAIRRRIMREILSYYGIQMSKWVN